jgi:serine/threonine protein kinase/pimeloyl-ACP methyl ester carboxylesterase
MSGCLTEQNLAAFVAGLSSAEEIATCKRHLRICDKCATELARFRAGLAKPSKSSKDRPSKSQVDSELGKISSLEPNIKIGDFLIEKRLGSGGMGIVYQARQLSLDRYVALKVLPPGLTMTQSAVERFHREAKAAAKLHHTNIVAIYAEGEESGTCYYAMELIEGQTLDNIINSIREFRDTKGEESKLEEKYETDLQRHSPAPVLNPSSLKTQTAFTGHGSGQEYFDTLARLIADVADALDYAHKNGIVHRDVKPSNLMLGSDGRLSLMDFGVARMLEEQSKTLTGSFIGTPYYMSPEQISGATDKINHRTDIYSLGVTLYELLTLQLPFTADNREQIISQILNKEPIRPRQLNDKIPLDLETICCKAIDKEPDKRYQSGRELAEDLRRYINRYVIKAKRSGPIDRMFKFVRRHKVPVAMAIGIGLAISTAGLTTWKYFTSQWVQKHAIPEIRRLVDKGSYFKAFDLANKTERFAADDPALAALWPDFSNRLSVNTKPAGAKVYVKPYRSVDSNWVYLGKSPINQARLARGLYSWKLTKAGYSTVEGRSSTRSGQVDFTLDKQGEIPPGMVRVSGGSTELLLTGMIHYEIELESYFIDKYEVTNQQFKLFVDSGGYEDQKYWKHEFIKEGEVLSWSDAMQEFYDQKGRPGPSVWENGTYPPGQDNFPVGGVSWYEAAAYAEFVDKNLPTIYHWSRAGLTRGTYSGTILPYSNFDQVCPSSVGQYQGMGNYGTYDMAGNHREWCWNKAVHNRRYILGGAWNEADYKSVQPFALDPFDRSSINGFRCVKYVSNISVPKAGFDAIIPEYRDYSKEIPISEDEFLIYKKTLFSYDKDSLNAVVVAIDDTANFWRHETVTFNAAYGNERLIAHLYIPKNAAPPYQTVIYFPGGSALFLDKFRAGRVPDLFLRSGRALLYPVYKATFERKERFQSNRPDFSLSFRDHIIMWTKDFCRAFDYLELREDIDHDKIAYYGLSWGGAMGAIIPAVEKRLKACVFVGGGFYFERTLPEVDQINFVPHIKTPVLMINGRYDGTFLVDKSQKPMFELLGTEEKNKRHLLFDSGHLPQEKVHEETLKWLDRYLGPVNRIDDSKRKGSKN